MMLYGAFERHDYTASFHIDYPGYVLHWLSYQASIYTSRHKQITDVQMFENLLIW